MPLEDGIDVISVNSLAFKRFLAIARLLNKETDVVTDNDGNVDALKAKYADYLGLAGIAIQYDNDESANTLEPQLLKMNGLAAINAVLNQSFADDTAALAWMRKNKAETGLRFFETEANWKVPGYIERAIR